MQQVVLYVFAVISNVTFFGKTYTNDNPLFVRKLNDSQHFLSFKRFTSTRNCERIVKITFEGIQTIRSLVVYCFSGTKFQHID